MWPPPLRNDLRGRTCRHHATTLRSWHVLKLPHATLLRNDLHGKFWLPVRNNVEKPTCTVAANTKQKNWPAHVPALGGPQVWHRTKRVPAAASTYMFHATNRPGQGADEVDAGKWRDKKPTIGG